MSILYFTTGSLHLLESLPVPASLIINNCEYYSNSMTAENGYSGITAVMQMLKAPPLTDGCCTLKNCNSTLKTLIMRAYDRDYMAVGINFNNTPGYLVLACPCGNSSTFTECIHHFESAAGFKRVVLVDDNPVIIDTYNSMLSLLGYDTFQFTNPLDALNSMSSSAFDLLVSDYDMPGMNGFELYRNFCKSRPRLPVIFITGSAEITGTKGQGHMVSVMNKPVTFDELRRSLELVEFFYTMCNYIRGQSDNQIRAMW